MNRFLRWPYVYAAMVITIAVTKAAFGQAYHAERSAMDLYMQCRIGDAVKPTAETFSARAYCNSYIEGYLKGAATVGKCPVLTVADALLLYRRYVDGGTAQGMDFRGVAAPDALWQAVFAPAGCGQPSR